jgi:glycopeptide antibiotics resistance protein
VRTLRFPFLWLGGGGLLIGYVLYMTLTPAGGFSAALALDDKLAHFLAFAALMTWFCGVFKMSVTARVALALLGLGLTIELLQGQLTYRTAEVADIFADGMGILLGWGISKGGADQWTRLIESWLPSRVS